MKLIFRADGNASLGLGHLIRSAALADMISPYFPIHFVINEDAPETISLELAKKYPVFRTTNDNHWLDRIDEMDGIVLDGYQFSSDIQMAIKKKNALLISIDDVHDKHFYSDLIINQALGITPSHYSAEPYTRFLFGPRYCIIRKAFLIKQKKNPLHNKRSTIFICFGGSDFQNITLRLLKELIAVPDEFTFNIVVGAAYQYLEELRGFVKSHPDTTRIFSNLDAEGLSDVARSSDIAIVPASSILLETLSLGIPSISGFYADNQRDIYDGYLQEGLLVGAGDFRDTKLSASIIINNLHREMEINNDKLSYYFDGCSPQRFAREFIELFSDAALSFHRVTSQDIRILFEWANDPETRNNAINTKPISWEEHEKWFLEKHNNPHTSMFIARFNELPIGQIRFDEVNDFMDLTYSVAPSHRGVGLGGQIVEKAIGVLREFVSTSKKIRAFVLEENVSSVKIFRKMGFTECPVAIKDGRRFYQFHYSLS